MYLALKHLKNNGVDPNLSEKPSKAIIALQNDRGTSYETYIAIQNELKSAYTIVRDEESLRLTNGRFTYKQLKVCIENNNKESANCKMVKEKVKSLFPMKITEKEPVETFVGKLKRL